MDKVKTKYGEFTACNDASDLRKKYRCPVEYHLNGNIKSIYLQEPEEISLPEGKFQAELITFYEDGNDKYPPAMHLLLPFRKDQKHNIVAG